MWPDKPATTRPASQAARWRTKAAASSPMERTPPMANGTENLPEIMLTSLGYGSVRFHKGEEARPASEATEGNVTTRTEAIPAEPSFFEVTFTIGVLQALEGLEAASTFVVNVPVPTETNERSYRDVELAAAQSLPTLLRKTAELIEADIERAERERAATGKE
ncbi:hypothetical protein [Roseovarius indicus]|uniref:hypothetical protein n=1 Tax=Roseovarius indicus TaxID=540747 RepID=UPI0010FF4568|nr:hypothetical protein [Roseovarius indicus]